MIGMPRKRAQMTKRMRRRVDAMIMKASIQLTWLLTSRTGPEAGMFSAPCTPQSINRVRNNPKGDTHQEVMPKQHYANQKDGECGQPNRGLRPGGEFTSESMAHFLVGARKERSCPQTSCSVVPLYEHVK